jgi:hypothetical protein
MHTLLHTACTTPAQVLHTARLKAEGSFDPAMWISADPPRREYVLLRRTSVARRQKAALFCPPYLIGRRL